MLRRKTLGAVLARKLFRSPWSLDLPELGSLEWGNPSKATEMLGAGILGTWRWQMVGLTLDERELGYKVAKKLLWLESH